MLMGLARVGVLPRVFGTPRCVLPAGLRMVLGFQGLVVRPVLAVAHACVASA